MYVCIHIHIYICIYTLENQSLMKDIVEQLKEHKDGDDKTSVIEFVIGDIVQVIGGELRYVYL
jgi:Na+/H+ antiporter NhaD/arsenite permease-like protein